MTPTPDNRAAQSLHRTTQAYNMKLVDVNARVTLVIWNLECITNIAILVTIVVLGQTSLGNTTNAMIWYYLIISYTFLMNTSYNKDRIIESGWRIVIFNAISGTLTCFSKPENIETLQSAIQHIAGKSEPGNDIELKDLPKVQDSSTSQNTSSTNCSNDNSSKTADQDIFIISSPDLDIFPSSSLDCGLKLKDLEKMKCKMWKNEAESKKPGRRKISKSISSDSESSITDDNRGKNYRMITRDKIFSEMRNRLDNENAYLHYFRQLVDFEDYVQKQDLHRYKMFQVLPFITFQTADKSKIKNTYLPADENSLQNRIQSRKQRNYEKVTSSEFHSDPEFSEHGLMRMQLRRDMIKNYTIFLSNEEQFGNFIDSLIEFEEGLIKEGQ